MATPRRFLPSIAALRALEALDRLGSASAAADELSLTQGAVSRQLQALERQLGIDLVRRDQKRLTLSPEAATYAGEIRQALNQIAQSTLRVQAAPLAGTLNLAILPAFGMRWLMPRLPEFARLHPDVTINMSTRLEPFNFVGEGFDAAIHFGTADWPGTAALLLKHEQMLPVCAPDLLGERDVTDPADIAALPLLHIQTRPQAWQQWFQCHNIDVSRGLSGTMYDQFATITQAALHGLGVALMPDYLVEQDLATGRLTALHPTATESPGAYYLVWPEARSKDPALIKFRNWLAGQAQPEDPLPR
ncbi:LysR family transcriptional regulator [Phaeobacter porticola]|uniref:Putative glycine cleavage system transcriptional activator n=1 Tax=Phaeobacter porticola TaxID=1844006 RepID=A0A1L3I4E9_9RHOB|nr:LysR family transcriptional regulator [Phaeobacter porticola]APG47003.1 putative glycine cleavage system transcriptional activator [Phaeobacter porticola]